MRVISLLLPQSFKLRANGPRNVSRLSWGRRGGCAVSEMRSTGGPPSSCGLATARAGELDGYQDRIPQDLESMHLFESSTDFRYPGRVYLGGASHLLPPRNLLLSLQVPPLGLQVPPGFLASLASP